MLRARLPLSKLLTGALLLALACVLLACSGDKAALAVLKERTAQTDKQAGTGPWGDAPVGAKFFLNDAVRTDAGTANLKVAAATIQMKPKTVLRFGAGKGGKPSLQLEEGQIEVSGGGFAFGARGREVAMEPGSLVRLIHTEGGTQIQLALGAARLIDDLGTAADLDATGVTLSLDDSVMVIPPDAPTLDAAPADAALTVDAAPAAATLTVAVTGKRAQTRPSPDLAWAKVPAGTLELAAGGEVLLGKQTSAVASRPGFSIKANSGSTLGFGDDGMVTLTGGTASAKVDANTAGDLKIPGAHLAITSHARGSGVSLEFKPKETIVLVTGGGLTINSEQGPVPLVEGERVKVLANGKVEAVHKIPNYYDMEVPAGQRAFIHDPRGETAVRFTFDECPNGGVIEVTSGSWNAPRTSAGDTGANHLLSKGAWNYRLRCRDSSKIAASGVVRVFRDDGRQAIPKRPPTNEVSVVNNKARGTSSNYPNLLPDINFIWKDAPAGGFRVTVSQGSKSVSFDASGQSVVGPGSKLFDGVSAVVFQSLSNPTLKTNPAKLNLVYKNDNQVQAFIDSPNDGEPFAAPILVRGATTKGWAVSVDGRSLPVNDQGRFKGEVSAPTGAAALVIKLVHPQRGVNYYLRRPR